MADNQARAVVTVMAILLAIIIWLVKQRLDHLEALIKAVK